MSVAAVAIELHMADPESSCSHATRNQTLKRLGFCLRFARKVVSGFSAMYEAPKNKTGPLKLPINAVEKIAQICISPAAQLFHDITSQLLTYADRKVDKMMTFIENHRHFPARLRSEVAVMVNKGILVTVERVAMESLKWSLRLPLGSVLLKLLLLWARIYNCMAGFVRRVLFTMARLIPLVPVDKISLFIKYHLMFNNSSVILQHNREIPEGGEGGAWKKASYEEEEKKGEAEDPSPKASVWQKTQCDGDEGSMVVSKGIKKQKPLMTDTVEDMDSRHNNHINGKMAVKTGRRKLRQKRVTTIVLKIS